MTNRLLTFSCGVWQRQKAVAHSQARDGEGKLLVWSLESVPSREVGPGILDAFQLRALPTIHGSNATSSQGAPTRATALGLDHSRAPAVMWFSPLRIVMPHL